MSEMMSEMAQVEVAAGKLRKPGGDVSKELDKLVSEVDLLEQTINEVGKELDPVMHPGGPSVTTGEAKEMPTPPPMVFIAQRISGLQVRIATARVQLRDFAKRLSI